MSGGFILIATATTARACRHCQTRPIGKPRGLCFTCYARPEVRARYPSYLEQKPIAPGSPVCRCCQDPTRRVNRPRGMCWGCYCSDRRSQCPSISPYAGTQEITDRNGTQTLPAEPTDAQPGTPEKIAVLAARAMRGEQLFHPDDVNCLAQRRAGRNGTQ